MPMFYINYRKENGHSSAFLLMTKDKHHWLTKKENLYTQVAKPRSQVPGVVESKKSINMHVN